MPPIIYKEVIHVIKKCDIKIGLDEVPEYNNFNMKTLLYYACNLVPSIDHNLPRNFFLPGNQGRKIYP